MDHATIETATKLIIATAEETLTMCPQRIINFIDLETMEARHTLEHYLAEREEREARLAKFGLK